MSIANQRLRDRVSVDLPPRDSHSHPLASKRGALLNNGTRESCERGFPFAYMLSHRTQPKNHSLPLLKDSIYMDSFSSHRTALSLWTGFPISLKPQSNLIHGINRHIPFFFLISINFTLTDHSIPSRCNQSMKYLRWSRNEEEEREGIKSCTLDSGRINWWHNRVTKK